MKNKILVTINFTWILSHHHLYVIRIWFFRSTTI